ncbi:non-canonical purine NTP diphosphatase [Gilvimarinus agarilyticus]|uniref:non-canonical purine NTP diphosphatase n=1 Tax=Reichenbachiella agariperforans TaxID=156994 RepID=UPI001C0963DC|nr:non-canonical purine NTP diphosphatase [Reichenbachiella agariperforans]MBU2886494.1 non-canonical purine NTP diphosphatase [Gilvimarinus agarilyticus]MBU2915296.1 non-canonical purine NTP diphosphatase [Reichenbachiella agariperforans]
MKICFATHNPNKLKEVRQILGDRFDVVGLHDIGCDEEIPEDGITLDENSHIKAAFVAKNFRINCFADDTGLEVEALDGAPGVYSARYAGEQKDNQANIRLLLEKLQGHANRRARFRTVITLLVDGVEHQFDGVVDGHITTELKGHEGFGYDPVFVPEGHTTTFAEMSAAAKNEISHRGRAMHKLVAFLQS